MSEEINGREPALGGQETSNAPSLSINRLLPGLREALESKDRNERLKIMETLRGSGAPPVAPMLAELMAMTSDKATRQRCIAMLGQLRDAQAVEPLIALLEDEDADLRKLSAWALGQIGDARALNPLLARLDAEPEGRVTANICGALAQIGSPRAVKPLLALRERTNQGPLYHVAGGALKTLASECDLALLIDLQNSPNPGTADWAAEVFLHYHGGAKPDLINALLQLLAVTDRVRVKEAAVAMLAAIPDQRAKNAVIGLLSHPNDVTRLAAIQAVGASRVQEAVDVLIEIARMDETPEQHSAIVALGHLDDPRIVPLLFDLLLTTNAWSIVDSLRKQGAGLVVKPLIERFRHAEGHPRARYLHALAHLAAGEAAPTLLDIAHKSPDPNERCEALRGLCYDALSAARADLVKILHDDPVEDVKDAAVEMLRRDLTPEGESALRSYLVSTDSDHMRVEIVCALIDQVPDGIDLFRRYFAMIVCENDRDTIMRGIPYHLIPEYSSDLIDLVDHDDRPGVKETAISVMAENLTTDAVQKFRQLLTTTLPDVMRASVVSALIGHGNAGPEVLREHLPRMAVGHHMYQLAHWFHLLSEEEHVSWMRKLYTETDDWWTRVEVASDRRFAGIGGAVPILLEALRTDPVPRVRATAAFTLANLASWPEDIPVAEALIAALNDHGIVESGDWDGDGIEEVLHVDESVASTLRSCRHPLVAEAVIKWFDAHPSD